VNVRSEARSSYQAYLSNYDIARHYRNDVLPLRTKVEEESLLTYNGMISNTFELLTDTRDKINSSQKSRFALTESRMELILS
ncbi:TolC family protein, partial [Rhizobium ruizarguesonis]